MVSGAVMSACACFKELEVDTEGLPLAIDEVAKLVAHAESWLSITEHFLLALSHVQVRFTKAYGAGRARLVCGCGTKGMVLGRP